MSDVTTTDTHMLKCLITKTFVLIEQTFRSNYQNIQIMYNVTHTPIWHIRSLCTHFRDPQTHKKLFVLLEMPLFYFQTNPINTKH